MLIKYLELKEQFVIYLFVFWKMFQAETESDYGDWTEAISVLIRKIENKTGLKAIEMEGKTILLLP